MLARERRQLITNALNRNGKLRTSDLVAQFGVSDVTIRADLDVLESDGRLTRTHGGAVPADGSRAAVSFDLRMELQSEAKRRIALRAAEFIRSDQTFILDSGTTTHHLARVLPEVSNLTVYTPGLTQAQELLGVSGVDVHLLGGQVDGAWLQTIGTPREQGIKGLLVERFFMGAFGIDADLDIVDQSPAMRRVKLQYVRRARTIVVLADSSKIGQLASTKVLPLEQVDVLITDSGLPPEYQERLSRLNLELIVV